MPDPSPGTAQDDITQDDITADRYMKMRTALGTRLGRSLALPNKRAAPFRARLFDLRFKSQISDL
jgi:hypothetical protein